MTQPALLVSLYARTLGRAEELRLARLEELRAQEEMASNSVLAATTVVWALLAALAPLG